MQTKTQTVKVNLGFNPHSAQKQMIESFLDDSIFATTVVCGRQLGKTETLLNLTIFAGLKYDGIKILVVSPTESQNRKLFKQIHNKLNRGKFLIKEKRESAGFTEIILANNSIIYFRSAGSGDYLRGLTVDYIFLDEAAFISELVVQEVIMPMLIVKSQIGINKKIFITTTPKGRNWVFKWFNLEKTNKRYKSFQFSSYDNPYANLDFINEQKELLPEKIFNQEYLGIFEDGGSIFNFIYDNCVLRQNLNNEKKYVGIDIGYSDYTVYSCFNEKKEQVYLKYIQSQETDDILNFIKKCNSEVNPTKTFIEVNSIGHPIYDSLKKEIKLTPWTTTASSKKEIINNYIADFNKKDVKLINDDEQIYQHQSFLYTPETGKFGGKSGSNDDIVMANAIAYECLKQSVRRGSYAII